MAKISSIFSSVFAVPPTWIQQPAPTGELTSLVACRCVRINVLWCTGNATQKVQLPPRWTTLRQPSPWLLRSTRYLILNIYFGRPFSLHVINVKNQQLHSRNSALTPWWLTISSSQQPARCPLHGGSRQALGTWISIFFIQRFAIFMISTKRAT